MNKNCESCNKQCLSKTNKLVLGYVLKEVNTGTYLDLDDTSGPEIEYHLHDNRSMALRFYTKQEAETELKYAMIYGLELDFSHLNPNPGFLKFRAVKIVKKSKKTC